MSRRTIFFASLFFVFLCLGITHSEEPEKLPNESPIQNTDPQPKTTAPRLSVKPVIKPSATPTPVQVGPNLVVNGNFDRKNPKHNSPSNWQLCDDLTSFYEKEEGRGFVLRFDTAVPKEQARERWQVMIEKGVDAPPAPKKEELKGIYSSIGAVDGIHFYSDPIPVKDNSHYRLLADIKGKTRQANYVKIFVKGYGTVQKVRKIRQPDGSIKEEVQKEVRQIFKWYLAAREVATSWKEFDEWIPCVIPQKVEFVKICLYPYWPNGEYYFDNIRLFEGKKPPEKDE